MMNNDIANSPLNELDTAVGVPLLGTLDRRRFLAVTGVGATAIAATAYFRPSIFFGQASAATGSSSATTSNIIVNIFLRGAADGLSFLSPLNDSTYQTLRPGVAIPDASALAVNNQFGLHPGAVRIKALLDAGQAAFVPAAGSPNNNRSHFSAQAMMDKGSSNDPSLSTGWLGRYFAATSGASDDALRGISVGNGLQPSLRGSAAIATPNLQSLSLYSAGTGASSGQVQTALRAMYPGASTELLRMQGAAATDLVAEIAPIASSAAAPTGWPTGFGSALWPIAKLISAGYPVEIATADLGGWDEHDAMGSATDPTGNQYKLVAGLDTALGAFFDYIGSAASRTTVIITTEFGRRIAINGSGGTDHGRGMVMMVLGAGVNPGVHGTWPGLTDTDNGDVKVVNDFRKVYAEVLGRRMRPTNLASVFPGFDTSQSNWLGVATA
ncbi:unannotated protein [freshwater metagenome]|uniref:Unannotated protein n=1 Tax=freshwater metagenome TaxID=449393 RepID=A0A6J6HX24_9ZZZZ|nr:DUF1501 domain-containing protein [Actinomycetota bacterium]